MGDGSTIYNEGLNRIWSQSDELIESYDISHQQLDKFFSRAQLSGSFESFVFSGHFLSSLFLGFRLF
jgi:hypothetical protein